MIQLSVIHLCILRDSSNFSSVLLMIIGKLYHYCANHQKTGDPEWDPEWEMMPSTLESMVDS